MMTKTLFIEKYPNFAAFLMNYKSIANRCLKKEYCDVRNRQLSFNDYMVIIGRETNVKYKIFNAIIEDMLNFIIECFNDSKYRKNEFLQDVIKMNKEFNAKPPKKVLELYFAAYMTPFIYNPIKLMIWWENRCFFKNEEVYHEANENYVNIIKNFI